MRILPSLADNPGNMNIRIVQGSTDPSWQKWLQSDGKKHHTGGSDVWIT